MAKVLGLGGVFYKAEDPAAVRDWYARVLGFEIHSWGGAVFKSPRTVTTNWALFGADTQYFAPSTAPFMINFVVDDIDGVLAKAAAEGVEPGPPG
jgi:catechol 2,3-dioxygenase-like lactoylglutathione lyase family enzyme